MSLRNELFKEKFKMSSAAAQQANTKASSDMCHSGPNPTQPTEQLKNLDPTRPKPTYGSTEPTGQLWSQ